MFNSKSTRRSRRQAKSRTRSRKLRAERLEERRLLAATEIESWVPPHRPEFSAIVSTAVGEGDHGRILHFINGEVHELAVDPWPTDEVSLTSTAGVSAAIGTSSAVYPLNSIPQLHSNPGAPATLYLDFNGHFQSSWGGYSNITTPVYDSDGDATTFSDEELAAIQSAWARVAEDYYPFNINVTTVEPAVLAPGMPASAANGKALRVSVGGNLDWFGGGGGVAYIDSFTSSMPNVAYVSATSASGSTISHEAGHAFGLYHQSTYDANGNLALEYNPGDAMWGPIMGLSATALTTWHNGPNSNGPTSYQDDIARIARSTNGFGYRADDHANTTAGATPLTGAGTDWSATGFIGTSSDIDWFSLDLATPESLRITIEGAPDVQNLDVAMELRDAAGALVATSNPGDSFDATVTRNLVGQYYVGVKSNGAYGRLGQYTVAVSERQPGVVVSTTGSPYTTSEMGRSESVTLVLESKPTANVTFNIESSDPSEGIPSTSGLVFTPENWFAPQTATITGVADGTTDGATTYTVTISSAMSNDPAYDGVFNPDDITLVNLDNTPGHLYWAEAYYVTAQGSIQRSSLAGENGEIVVDLDAQDGNYYASRIAIDATAGKIYWTTPSSDAIRRTSLDGSSPETILSGLPNPLALAVDPSGAKVYWFDSTTKKIQRANLDGTAVEDLITTGLNMFTRDELELDLTAGKMYWTDQNSFTISRANLDGSGVEVVLQADGIDRPNGLELDITNGKMYYALRDQNTFASRLYRANLDGGNPQLLVDVSALGFDPTAQVYNIAIDHASARVYWSASRNWSMRIYSADLDGSKVASIADNMFGGMNHAGAPLAILPVLPGFSATPTSGLATTEAGGTATFSVVLNAAPTADVVIPLSSSDATEGTVSPLSLTFTPANWDVPQTVTVTGVEDAVYDQDVAYTVLLGAAMSSDAAYNGLNPADVAVVNRDNDLAPTKFYVVDDGSANRTYEYGVTGAAVENYTLNSGNTAPRGAASTAAGDKVWVVDANRTVYVYNTSGGLLGSWSAGSLASNATVEGIATNGTDVWIVDARSDKVFKYTGAASRTSGSQNSASSFNLNSTNTSPKDIVTNGTHLWVVNDSLFTDKVFKYTVGGSLAGSWTISSTNSSPTGITIDPANVSDIWIVDSGTDRVYRYTGAASRTSGSQSAALSFALASGNSNPQGIADPPTPDETNGPKRDSKNSEIDFSALPGAVQYRGLQRVERAASARSIHLADDFVRDLLNRGENRPTQNAGLEQLWADDELFDSVFERFGEVRLSLGDDLSGDLNPFDTEADRYHAGLPM